MKVLRLTIEHFRGINKAAFHFDGHALLIGMNNVGKSTVCEALDLVLGPDRLNKFPPVEEFDFYNAEYLGDDGETAIPARIEVVLTELTREIELACPTHTEFWHVAERRLLGEGEADLANSPDVIQCLRLETVARYDKEEDEFEAKTYFCHGTNNIDDSPEQVRKKTKRLFGFLYLRALRTGSRALSLERGSLLDVILRIQGIRTGLWESSIKRLRELDPPIADDAAELAPVLETIEKRLAQYIQLHAQDRATRLFVSKLTREHLRETISFFLSTSPGQKPVPFQEAGTGTLNTLVLALLSFIADVKKDNVIFAMEEPEIALPPHTQRRIAKYLLTETTQCFVTTHSPYVIEQFNHDQIHILRRDESANVKAIVITLGSTLKEKMYRKHTRRGLAEAMLGQGVIVAEGISEQAVLATVASKMELADKLYYPLDLSGVTIFPVEGDGSMSSFGAFFRTLGLKTYAFYDKKQRKPEENQKLADTFDIPNETAYPGIELLLVSEIPVDRQWQFLESLRQSGEHGHLGIPAVRPADPEIRDLLTRALKSNKGNGYAAGLIDLCGMNELPASITGFLVKVFSDFPALDHVPIPVPSPAPVAAAVAGVALEGSAGPVSN
jgi:putative ATP-dependent endonuclease of OLD family